MNPAYGQVLSQETGVYQGILQGAVGARLEAQADHFCGNSRRSAERQHECVHLYCSDRPETARLVAA